jgi:hypothetical protein
MPREKTQDATRRYERYLKVSDNQVYVLRLYVTGATPAFTRAIANLKALPLPLRRFIGDLSDLEGKLFGLDVRPSGDLRMGPV